MLHALLRETGRPVSKEEAERIQRVHAEAFVRQAPSLRILPGAQALLDALTAVVCPLPSRPADGCRARNIP